MLYSIGDIVLFTFTTTGIAVHNQRSVTCQIKDIIRHDTHHLVIGYDIINHRDITIDARDIATCAI